MWSRTVALIMALHGASQRQLPVTMVAAGLAPQLLGQMGRAKSYAERLLEYVSRSTGSTYAATAALARRPKERA